MDLVIIGSYEQTSQAKSQTHLDRVKPAFVAGMSHETWDVDWSQYWADGEWKKGRKRAGQQGEGRQEV